VLESKCGLLKLSLEILDRMIIKWVVVAIAALILVVLLTLCLIIGYRGRNRLQKLLGQT
jgi:hypothetical protein